VTHSPRLLTVVSYYAARDSLPLRQLISQLVGRASQVVISVNDERVKRVSVESVSPWAFLITRPNVGMNIGAWNDAYAAFPAFDYYLFLQDECYLKTEQFEVGYLKEFVRSGAGMLGESVNRRWNGSWEDIAKSPMNYLVETEAASKRVRRVEYYLQCLKDWGIAPGENAAHLRSLVWGFSRSCLSALGGFPVGQTKEQCIAAEIGVSRAVVSKGFSFKQVSDSPFAYFGHSEWRDDGESKIYPPDQMQAASIRR
jgi:hypothetical protein